MDVTGQLLTTTALVALYDPATSAIDSTVVDSAIGGASERMLRHVGGRIINPTVSVIERQQIVRRLDAYIFCQERPVLAIPAIVVTFNGSVLTLDDDYVIDLASGLITRLSDDRPVDWLGGDVKLEYDTGYAVVPKDLEQLATMQVVAELMKTDQKFFGIKQKDPTAGTTVTLEDDGLLPSVKEGLIPWRREAYAGATSFG